MHLNSPQMAATAASNAIENLIYVVEGPTEEAVPSRWAALQRDEIKRIIRIGIDAFQDKPEIQTKLRRAESLALRFIGLIDSDPELSKSARRYWTVPAECRLYDALAALHAELAKIAESGDFVSVQSDVATEKESGTVAWSEYRSPADWRKLLREKGKPNSAQSWRNLRRDYPDDIQGHDKNQMKNVRVSRSLVEDWGLDLSESRRSGSPSV